MRRSVSILSCLTLVIIAGVGMAFLFSGGRAEQLPAADPAPSEKITSAGESAESDPAGIHEVEVFFTTCLAKIPIPLNTLTPLDRGHVYTEPKGGGGAWELKANRTATHLTITHESDIGGTYRKQEYTIALSDLPMKLPHEKISTMTSGRFDAAKRGQKSTPTP